MKKKKLKKLKAKPVNVAIIHLKPLIDDEYQPSGRKELR